VLESVYVSDGGEEGACVCECVWACAVGWVGGCVCVGGGGWGWGLKPMTVKPVCIRCNVHLLRCDRHRRHVARHGGVGSVHIEYSGLSVT
jgi:hypothetical protein